MESNLIYTNNELAGVSTIKSYGYLKFKFCVFNKKKLKINNKKTTLASVFGLTFCLFSETRQKYTYNLKM